MDKTPSQRRATMAKRAKRPLRVLGTSVTQIAPIKRAAEQDLGIELEFITLDGTEAQRRGALNPESFDVYDQWFHDLDLIWPTGSLQPIEIARIDRWNEINNLPKAGRLSPDVPQAAGGDPSRRLYVQLDGSLGKTPSRWISMVPTVHNADGFAIVGHDSDSPLSWKTLLDPSWAGRVVLQSDAAIGSIEMLLALQASGEFRANDIGDLSPSEIDTLVEIVTEYRERGHFRCFWADEAEAVDAMRSGGAMIGSLWWSGITQLRTLGAPVKMATPMEGYRGWFGGLSLSSHLDDGSRDAAYDYLNWWLDGRPGALMARIGAYISNPETARSFLTEAEWAFWYEGSPATEPIRDPDGRIIFETGMQREGGSYSERVSRIAVWDTVMNEHNYLVRRWESALE